jgi:hypothetical protein
MKLPVFDTKYPFEPTGEGTLADAQRWLLQHIEKGAKCPCCTQFAKVYKNPLNASMACAIIQISRCPKHKKDAAGFLHVPSHLNDCGLSPRTAAAVRGHWPKLMHWGLIEPKIADREDGSWRNGYWRILPSGINYIHRRISVPRYVHIYNSIPLGLFGEPWPIDRALGTHFNYAELMAL